MFNKKSFFNLLKGALIGVSMIIPGVSGGTVAVLLNIYNELIEAITNLKSSFKKSICFLAPIGVGMILAFAAMYFPLKLALKYIPLEIISLFAGLMVGSLPNLYRNALKNGYKKFDFMAILVPFIVVIGICFIPGLKAVNLTSSLKPYMYIILILVGILASVALVVPGISGSMLLLILGFYEPLLNTISALKIAPIHSMLVLCLFIIGLLIGFFTIAKLMKYLLNKFPRIITWIIFGFVVGSIIAIYLSLDYKVIKIDVIGIVLSILLVFVGMFLSYKLISMVSNKESD